MAVDINGDGLIALGGTSSTQGRLRLAEDTDNGTNYIELTAPASVASNRTITFPDATTTVVGTDTTQTLTNKTLTSPTITGAVMSSMASSVITSATAQASTSGTSIDFTGIPSWVKNITVMFSGVSTNGASIVQIQLGDSGGFETSNYLGACGRTGTGTGGVNNSSGFFIDHEGVASGVRHGSIIISLLNSATNTWAASGVIGRSDSANVYMQGGSKALSDTLTQVRITSVNGTDTFDAGTINILYE